MVVPAASIGLPTTGATIHSAKLVHDGRGEYCKVLGGVHPVDPKAQDIRFEVNLPVKWNGQGRALWRRVVRWVAWAGRMD